MILFVNSVCNQINSKFIKTLFINMSSNIFRFREMQTLFKKYVFMTDKRINLKIKLFMQQRENWIMTEHKFYIFKQISM